MFDTIEFCDSLLPKDRPRYLMGVGRPTDIVQYGVELTCLIVLCQPEMVEMARSLHLMER